MKEVVGWVKVDMCPLDLQILFPVPGLSTNDSLELALPYYGNCPGDLGRVQEGL